MTPEARYIEMLEVLAGVRVKTQRGRAAVRIEDLEGLLEIPERLQAKPAAGAAPTKAEFDALVRDVDTMRLRLFAAQTALALRMK